MLKHIFSLAVFAGIMSLQPASAFDLSRSTTPTVLPDTVSAVPNWVSIPAERGDTVWDYCDQFLGDMGVTDIITSYQCSKTTMDVNGYVSWNDFRSIEVGELVLLPSPNNNGATIRARAASLGDNPMGWASEIRRLVWFDDAITARLKVLETTKLNRAEVETMIQDALAADLSNVDAGVFAEVISTINARINNAVGISPAEVNELIAEALLSAGVPSADVLQAIDVGMQSLNKRMTAVEDELKTKVSTTELNTALADVNARINDLTSTTATTTTTIIQERNWWLEYLALAVGGLALLLVVLLWSFKPSKKTVDDLSKEVHGRVDFFAQIVTDVENGLEVVKSDIAFLYKVTTNNRRVIGTPNQAALEAMKLGEYIDLLVEEEGKEGRIVRVVKGTLERAGKVEDKLYLYGVTEVNNGLAVSEVSLNRCLCQALLQWRVEGISPQSPVGLMSAAYARQIVAKPITRRSTKVA